MKWRIQENEPDLVGCGYELLCDGEEVPAVTKFDTEEGEATGLCQNPDHGKVPHQDVNGFNRPCFQTYEGTLELRPVSGPVPVRWQEVEKGSPSYSPIHAREDDDPYLTRCGKGVPEGAWAGESVRKGPECPDCWRGS